MLMMISTDIANPKHIPAIATLIESAMFAFCQEKNQNHDVRNEDNGFMQRETDHFRSVTGAVRLG
jgi:hypothetical protein